jgi:hypothetical protein
MDKGLGADQHSLPDMSFLDVDIYNPGWCYRKGSLGTGSQAGF